MAIETEQQRHRPGAFKQQNKAHKHGRHKSKGSLETLKKGKTAAKAISQKAKRELNKIAKRNQAAQIRHKKRDEYMQKKRGLTDAPFLIALVPLNTQIRISNILALFKEADSEAIISYSSESHMHIGVPRFRQRFTVASCGDCELTDVLDTLRVSDSVLFLVGPDGIDAAGELTLTAALAQGLPAAAAAATGLASLPQKRQTEARARLQKAIGRWLPEERLSAMERPSDALLALRRVGAQKLRRLLMRERRPHLLAESVEFVPDHQGSVGTLKVTGYLRGQVLSVDSLVHIAGWGSFRMAQIDAPPDPHRLVARADSAGQVKVLAVADPAKQESLDCENVPDPMDGEQTWPDEQELAEAEAEAETRTKRAKRVPAGMSDYQAAWIPDCDAEDVDEDDGEDDDDEDGGVGEGDGMECESESESESDSAASEEAETMTVTSETPVAPDKYDKQLDLTEEQQALLKIREAREEQMFPDEVDTPMDTPARVRFQRYRGLQSFRTSPWDPKENLPSDYARIFQFQNFDKTKKRVFKEAEDANGALPGWYVTVHVEGVPAALANGRLGTRPVVLFGMLPHEQKMSVVNMVLRRPTVLHYDEPIGSKEPMQFQCGFRRFTACPIFSQHTNGTKHKYERFFQPEAVVVATVYAPIMFPPASVLAFQTKPDGSQVLAAVGSLLSVSPDRVVVKRVRLSGHPFRVHKRSAVVRFMFFDRRDVDWFRPVELRTKYGRRGHIKEPLGTHGHMKCIFDGQLKSQDTVLLNLYKRVFPKWTFDDSSSPPSVPTPAVNPSMETE